MPTESTPSHTIAYRRDIDGLRGIAVLAVLLYHAHLGFSGGFVGVDIFFAISGFLITAIVLKRLEDGTFTMTDFWLRRLRRLAPAGIVMIVATLIAANFVLLPIDLRRVGQAAMFQAAAVANIYFWKKTDYFSGATEQQPLMHMWSLSVEEQFYLVLPVVLLIFRLLPRRKMVVALAVAAAISFGWSCYRVNTSPTSAFFLLPSRAWEMLAGSLLAFVPAAWYAKQSPKLLSLAGYAGAGMIGVAIFGYTDTTVFPGPTALLPVLGAVLIIASAGKARGLNRLLCSRPVVGLGLISYSLYLWHWPVMALTGCWWVPTPSSIAWIAVAASVGLGYLSWKYVETPYRRPSESMGNRRFVIRVLQAQACVIAIGGGLDLLKGIPSRMPEQVIAMQGRNLWARVDTEEIEAGDLPIFGVDDESVRPTLMLIGDSHAEASASAVRDLAETYGLRGYGGVESHPHSHVIPLPGETKIAARVRAIEQFIVEKELTDLIIIERWEYSFRYRNPEDETLSLTDAERGEVDQLLPSFCERLNAAGCHVHLMAQVPRQEHEDLFKMKLIRAVRTGEPLPGVDLAQYEADTFWREPLKRLANAPGVSFVEVAENCFDDAGRSLVIHDGAPLYRDDDHISLLGAELFVKPSLEPSFQRIAASRELPFDVERTARIDGVGMIR